MKIVETGEAFFVFETEEEELPEMMLTSPVLSPRVPEGEEPFSGDEDDRGDDRDGEGEVETNRLDDTEEGNGRVGGEARPISVRGGKGGKKSVVRLFFFIMILSMCNLETRN